VNSAAVPLRLLRSASAYRTIGAGAGVRIGAGFLLKSGRSVDFPWGVPGHYSAVWCLRGSCTYVDDARRAHAVRPGTLFHRFHDRRHGNTLDPASHWAECFIMLPDALAAALLAAGVLDHRRPVAQPGIDLGLIGDLEGLRAALERAGESELPRLMNSLAGLLIDILAREDAADAPRRRLIDEACRRLGDDPRCDAARLARDLGMGYERFRKVFRAATGVAPDAYRIRRRIDRARRLLVGSDATLADIATELGYPNPFAFSAQFKRHVGESPEAYRKRH